MLASERTGPFPGSAGGGERQAALLLENARYLEVILHRFRYAAAVLAVLMAAGRGPCPAAAVLVLAAVPVAVHGGVRAALGRAATLRAARLVGRWVLAADAALALGTYLAYLGDPSAIPAAFVPLVVFEIVFRFGGRLAAAAAMALFTAAVSVRVLYQEHLIAGGQLRWPMLLVWVLLAVLLLVLAAELRAQVRRRLAAQHDRERIAGSFQEVVGEVLARSGVPPHAATWDDVLTAVRRLCDEQPAECATIAASIAGLLVPAARDFGLTRREQEIVRLLATGYTYDRIARSLFVTSSTVRNHAHNVRSKLGLSTQQELIAFARSRGLGTELTPPPTAPPAQPAPQVLR